MKDKHLNLDEIETSHTDSHTSFQFVNEERGDEEVVVTRNLYCTVRFTQIHESHQLTCLDVFQDNLLS
jgi:hypothetical protein